MRDRRMGRAAVALVAAAALALGSVGCGSEDRPGGGGSDPDTTDPSSSVPDTSPDVTLPDVTLPDVTLPDITLPGGDAGDAGDGDTTAPPTSTVDDTGAADDDDLSPAAIVVIALIALAGAAWIVSAIRRHRTDREGSEVAALERRHRIDTLVRTSQWADGQIGQVLAADDPATLAPARSTLHGYLDTAQLDAAHLASDVPDPEHARSIEALGLALASARGALISYLDLAARTPRPTEHDLGLVRRRLEERRAELRSLTAQVQELGRT